MGVGELVVLDRAVLDVVADPLAKVLAHLKLLVARSGHRGLKWGRLGRPDRIKTGYEV